MMRNFTPSFCIALLWLTFAACDEEEIAAPPKPSLQASTSTALTGQTITFTVNEVKADAISLLPYGSGTADAGIVISKFTDGRATVTFAYSRPGVFKAIAVANNHSKDGAQVQNVHSEPVTITISSNNKSISAFAFSGVAGETTIDESAKTIAVKVPYGTDVSKLKATFTASPFSKVTIGGTEQVSGTTQNSFSSPVIYRVTAHDGSFSDYTVTVNVTPVDTANTIKSLSAIAASSSAGEKPLGVSIDNANRTIVIYDTLGTPSTQFDSMEIAYELDGAFARLKYNGKNLAQETVIDLTTEKEFQLYSQDSANSGGIQTYRVLAVAAPKLGLSFPALVPDPAKDVQPSDFSLNISVLSGTDITNINTATSTSAPAGVSVTGMKVNGVAFVSGSAVDYSDPVEFELTINDVNMGLTYKVIYTVTVTVVP